MSNTGILYSMTVTSHAVNSQCILNGFSVFEENSGESISSTFGVNEWLLDGVNKMEIQVEMIGDGMDPSALFEVTINPGDKQPDIFEFKWQQKSDALSVEPIEQTEEFELQNAGRNWAWEKADLVIDVDDASRKEIFELVTALHESISSRNTAKFRKLTELKNKDLCRAYGISKSEFFSFMDEVFREFFGDPGTLLQPLDSDTLLFKPQCEGKAIAVVDLISPKPIRTIPDSEGAVIDLGVMVSKIGGRWAIVR